LKLLITRKQKLEKMIPIVLSVLGMISIYTTIYLSLANSPTDKNSDDWRREYRDYLKKMAVKPSVKQSNVIMVKKLLFNIWIIIVFMCRWIINAIVIIYTIILLTYNMISYMISICKFSYKTVCIIITCIVFIKMFSTSIINFTWKVICWII